jgi:hypothetical protein
MKQNITIFAKRIYGQINWFTMKRRLYTSDFYTKSAFRNYALSSSLFSVWYETLIFHSPSVENVKFEVDIEPSRNACEVFKARELTFVNDCFKHERRACFDRRRKLIGVLYQALFTNIVTAPLNNLQIIFLFYSPNP